VTGAVIEKEGQENEEEKGKGGAFSLDASLLFSRVQKRSERG
jgi:hypothetical protein